MAGPDYNPKFVAMFGAVLSHVTKLLSDDTGACRELADKSKLQCADIAKVYGSGDQNVQTFVRFLALFVSSFLKVNPLSCTAGMHENTSNILLVPHEYSYVLCALISLCRHTWSCWSRATRTRSAHSMLRISKVNHDVVFKITLDCWSALVVDLYDTQRKQGGSVLNIGPFNQTVMVL
jgi:hypothetical protein